MIDPTSFSPPIKKGDAPLSASQVTRKLSKAADRVLIPLHQKQVLFTDSDDPVLAGKSLKQLIAENGDRVQRETIAINAFNHQLAARSQAEQRLAKIVLADGRPEITEQQETGELDEDGNPIMETVIVQSAIEPLPATVTVETFDEETGEPTGTEDVPNPAIVQDEAERAEAQATLDALPQAVLDWEPSE